MRRLRGPYAIRYDWMTGAGVRHPPQTFLDDMQSEAEAIKAGHDAFRLSSGRDLSLVGVAWCRVTRRELKWQQIQRPDSDTTRLAGLSPESKDSSLEDRS